MTDASRLRASLLLACLLVLTACGGVPTTSVTPEISCGCGGCGPASAAALPGAPSPACSSGPDPSPLAVSEARAIALSEAFTGESGTVSSWMGSGPAGVIAVRGTTWVAVIDGASAAVLEAFRAKPDIVPPDVGPPSWSPAPSPSQAADQSRESAVAAAAKYFTGHDITLPAAAPSTTPTTVGPAGWLLTWSDAAGVPSIEAVVCAADGTAQVMAWRDRRATWPLATPYLDRDEAITLAIARMNADDGRSDEQLISAELQTSFPAVGASVAWMVGVGKPVPDPSDGGVVWEFGGALSVDAVTGAIERIK